MHGMGEKRGRERERERESERERERVCDPCVCNKLYSLNHLKRCAVFKQDPQLESGLTLFKAKVMLEYLNVYICSTKK
jgi:hypothetical protein